MTENPIIEKIRKLRNKANDASVTEAEALLYSEKVAQLLAEHGLSMMDVAEVDREDHVESVDYEMMYSDPWRMSLFRNAERLYFCYSFRNQHVVNGKLRWGRTIVGRPHNIIMLRETYEYLEKTTLQLAREYAAEHDHEYSSRRAAQIGFERGCGTRLAARLYELYEKQAKPHEPTNPGNLPALYRAELELAKDFANKKYSLKSGSSRGSSINEHGMAGRRAAEGVSLSAQVSGSSRGNLLR